MISQETKDQIENDARQNAKAYRNSFEPKLVSKDTLLEAELAYRYSEIAVATKYAEKFEEKEIERAKEQQRADWFESEFNRMVANKKHEDARLEEKNKEISIAQSEREGWNKISVDYAIALEKAEKIIESKDKELMAMANITRQTELNLKLQVEAKETELAQLKEIAERMAKVIETWNKGGNYDAPNAFTAYAEWCKQINKAK